MFLLRHVFAWDKQPIYKIKNSTPRPPLAGTKLLELSQLTDSELEQVEDCVQWDKLVCQAAKAIYLGIL
jgi:hypothetical protein